MLIRGVIADSTSTPISSASIVFVDGPVDLPEIAAIADDGGVFTLAAPAPGPYRLGCHADGFDSAEITVTVGEADVDVECRLRPTQQ